jgi:hypothetical protein
MLRIFTKGTSKNSSVREFVRVRLTATRFAEDAANAARQRLYARLVDADWNGPGSRSIAKTASLLHEMQVSASKFHHGALSGVLQRYRTSDDAPWQPAATLLPPRLGSQRPRCCGRAPEPCDELAPPIRDLPR